MKTLKKIAALIILFAGILLNRSTITAQYCGPYGSNARFEIQTTALNPYLSLTVGSGTCTGAGTLDFPGMGINIQAPNYMLDILCDPTITPATNMDVNISSIGGSGFTANAVGYRIGDSMMLWHNGIISSIFVGVYAGGDGVITLPPAGAANTFVGNLAGFNNTSLFGPGVGNTYLGFAAGNGEVAPPMIHPGDSNVYIGAYSGYNNLQGGYNVFSGNHAGYTNINGDSNVFIGNNAGYSNSNAWGNNCIGNFSGYSNTTGKANVFIGNRCGYFDTASWNTFAGNHCGFHNVSGNNNSFYGKHCGYSNDSGSYNSFLGSHCAYNNVAGSANCAYGASAFWSNVYGTANVVIGKNADYNGGNSKDTVQNLNVFIGFNDVPSFYAGDSNVYVGALSDINTANNYISNSGAFGYGAVATANNRITMGNNQQNIGIGMSGLNPHRGPTNRLEISNFSQVYPDPCGPFPSTFTEKPCPNRKQPTGASGLQFRDLTTASIPWPYAQNHSFLTVDDSGNVVYMQLPPLQTTDTGGGFGTCCRPSTFPANDSELGCSFDPAMDLAANGGHNLWFQGNGIGSNLANVLLGYQCGTPPPAKLSVLQASNTPGSMCAYFENQDPGGCPFTPVYGIKSLVSNTSGSATKIAGWFEATRASTCCKEDFNQYAILVPQNGGNVEIGVNVTPDIPCANHYLLDVYGTTNFFAGYWFSDSTLKTNVSNISNTGNALSTIEKLNGVSYNYVNSVISDSGMTGTHYGFIAQQVQRVLPNVVKTDSHGLEGVAYTEIIPYLVEGMKQQQGTIDSLKNVLNSIQNCLNTLCGGSGDAPVHHSGGNGNSADSNSTISNTQEVTLSGTLNAPLLYQNIPNPFSTGTKINYYLPLATQGATIEFYDSYGNQIKSVPLSQTGNGTLNITPDNLSAGIYSYSLIVNNNVIDTKRMILQK